MNKEELMEMLKRQEGRTLEFKKTLPSNSDLAKTVVAFANDAGGEILIGIDDDHSIAGLPENELPQTEEHLSNMIYDRCYPAILPDISFISIGDCNILRVRIYRGSTPPYYLKSEGKFKGTYIRVGSTNRLADEELILELERRRKNLSFDGEIVMEKAAADLDISGFGKMYEEKTGETLDETALTKLGLVKKEREESYPVNALVLLSDDGLRKSLFPNAKIECARFKGLDSETFIDQKTIDSNIAAQAEEAYAFVLRHINRSARVQGVYTVPRWEYPIKAIREIIRNAVVHRQYSLSGKDIKIAIYDDMVEITSPGLLPPSIDYSAMESRQSDARNKVIAPVFKKLGIIDQWGNGLKLVAEELKKYPEIVFRWREVGLSFQVQFIKKSYLSYRKSIKETIDSKKDTDIYTLGGHSRFLSEGEVTYGLCPAETDSTEETQHKLLELISLNPTVTIPALAKTLGLSQRSCERAIATLKASGALSRIGTTRRGRWVVTEGDLLQVRLNRQTK